MNKIIQSIKSFFNKLLFFFLWKKNNKSNNNIIKDNKPLTKPIEYPAKDSKFTSVSSPDIVYSHLKEGNQIEVLRRIYLGNNNLVYYVKRIFNDEFIYNEVINVTKNIPLILKNHIN